MLVAHAAMMWMHAVDETTVQHEQASENVVATAGLQTH